MPPDNSPKLPWPRGMERGRVLGSYPDNLLDVLAYWASPGGRDRKAPHQLSDQQKVAAFDLIMHCFEKSRNNETLDDVSNRSQHILAAKEDRKIHALFSDALLDGVVALKETVEDRLVCIVEIDFDRVNKQKSGQTHEHLVPAITWRLPQLLRDNLQAEKTLTRMENGLAKAVVRLTNELPVRRNYGRRLAEKVRMLLFLLTLFTHCLIVPDIQSQSKDSRQQK